jgi:putative transposase
MLKVFKYKLQPNRKQSLALQHTLDICRDVFNLSLEQRKMQRTHAFAQMRELTQLKQEFPEYKEVHVHVLQNVIKKLQRSFENMWERGAGFPRFKPFHRYNSFQFNNTGFQLAGRYLQLSKIGNVKLRLSREIPEGSVIKTLSIKKSVSGWYACLAVDVPTQPLPQSKSAVGIDLGIENFAALSDGTMIQNPRFYEQGQAELRVAQRRVARRKKGSIRRRKAVVLLKKVHEHIQNKRLDWTHKVTTDLVNRFGTIVLENLNIKGLAQGILAKQVHDCGWSQFITLLKYKAESAGRRVVEVDVRYTSQECPACGTRKKKLLSERTHECSECGLVLHRDTAAAQVILGRMCPSDAKIGEPIPCLV